MDFTKNMFDFTFFSSLFETFVEIKTKRESVNWIKKIAEVCNEKEEKRNNH